MKELTDEDVRSAVMQWGNSYVFVHTVPGSSNKYQLCIDVAKAEAAKLEAEDGLPETASKTMLWGYYKNLERLLEVARAIDIEESTSPHD